MTLTSFQGSVELGIIYAIMALGVFISFRTLNMPDLTVDGSFVLGAAVSATMCVGGQPFIGLPLSFLAGCGAGCVTALLHTKLKIQPLLAGILTMLALYSVNLRVMGNKANIPLINKNTVFSVLQETPVKDYSKIVLSFGLLVVILIALLLFLKTELGLALRATGDNEHMVKALGVNTGSAKLIGLALSNGFVALTGAIIAQYQSFSDISMGTGMVIIGLASVIIGEVLFGTRSLLYRFITMVIDKLTHKPSAVMIDALLIRLIAVVLGSILYRLIIALAFDIGMPPTDLKLVSAVIVAVALSTSAIREHITVMKKRISAGRSRREAKTDVKN